MYNTISQFIADWQNETQATKKVLERLTDQSLNQKVYEHGRTLGQIAWHITQTIPEILGQAGLELDKTITNIDTPDKAVTILDSYTKLSNQLIDIIQKSWTDASLPEIINMYGEQWSREQVLQILIRHEIHHRAQITILMRQAGLKVPGLYGPSYEEWIEMTQKH